ncbi:MAG: acyltransferase [Muribaculaceae bacterium]|nr:acyltransferase [Muribaculaceae bacterium]
METAIASVAAERKNYLAIDVMKFIMSLAVVAIHVRAALNTAYPGMMSYLISLAVPFFFVTSGFLIYSHYNESRQSVAKYYFIRAIRFVRLFVIWAIIYLPLSILYYSQIEDTSWYHDILSYTRRFITSGDLPYAWPLWYLHAMAVALLIIAALLKAKCNVLTIWCIGLLLLLVAYCHDVIDFSSNPNPFKTAVGYYNLIFNTTRNGVFWGIGYVSAGMMIAKYGHRLHPLMGILSLIVGYLLMAFGLPFAEMCGAIGVFLFCKAIDDRYIIVMPLPLRSMSSVIYFTHMFFIVPLILYSISHSELPGAFVTWCLMCILSILLSLFVIRLMRMSRFAWLKQLF